MWISHLHLLMDHSFSKGLLTSGPDLDALFAFERERERECAFKIWSVFKIWAVFMVFAV